MSTEEQQNIIREKLNELKEIPEDFRFDDEMAWKRLAMRLESRSQKQGPAWLYLPVSFLNRLLGGISELLFAPSDNKRASRRGNRKRLNPKALRIFTMHKRSKE